MFVSLSKKILVLSLVSILVTLTGVSVYFYAFSDRNVLWKIVSEQCVPNYLSGTGTSPCTKVDMEEGVVTFKDRKGAFHYLLMPTEPISGIESAALQSKTATNYFHYAWLQRGLLGLPESKQDKHVLSVAVNSKFGRSQDHLHLHIACLRASVATALLKVAPYIDSSWKTLPVELSSHRYIARKISASEMQTKGPFQLLTDSEFVAFNDIERYGLAMTSLDGYGFVLLATERDILDWNFGSSGTLQDYDCQ